MKFRPLHDRVVIRRIEGEDKTKGGIIIPDTVKEKPQEGEVVAVGPGGRDENGKITPTELKPGERVLFGKWSGTEVKIDGEELLIMKETDVMGVIEGATAAKKLQERLAKLAGGVAIIRVGGSTEVEVKEKKDRVDDAMHATKAAVEEGIVSGGGVALLRARAAIGKLTDSNEDVQSGINIVLRALEAPIRQIAENSGVEGSIVVGKVLENKSQTFGFDAQTEQYVDMLNAGIVDPAKVVRVALQDAASIAGLMITTEAMIAERPTDRRSGDAGRRRNGRDGLLIARRAKTGPWRRASMPNLSPNAQKGRNPSAPIGRRVLCKPWLGIRENR